MLLLYALLSRLQIRLLLHVALMLFAVCGGWYTTHDIEKSHSEMTDAHKTTGHTTRY